MYYLLFLLPLALAGYLIVEYILHCHKLKSIPIRIHVNGTRGKSSVTRLIAAALREQGIKTFAKTTGTLPRMIMDDGKEYPIHRPGGTNIIEQLRIIDWAASEKAEALVIECMAVQPRYQSLTELKLIQSTHGVITNARADHLDVMGPTERDVTLALLGSTPVKGKLFTAEWDYPEEFKMAADDRSSELITVERDDVARITEQDLSGFNYVEHKENVALVLKVCQSLNISKDTALQGMWKAKRDPGAMTEVRISFFGRDILFVNGFAANDPESSLRIWHMALNAHAAYAKKIMVISTRSDRPDRSKQLGESIITWPQADAYVVIGDGVYQLFKTAIKSGVDPSKLICAERMPTERVFEQIVEHVSTSALVMGIGNIVGPGMDLVKFFNNRRAIA